MIIVGNTSFKQLLYFKNLHLHYTYNKKMYVLLNIFRQHMALVELLDLHMIEFSNGLSSNVMKP